MRKHSSLLLLLLILGLALAACGGGKEPAPADEGGAGSGDAAAGEKLFNQTLIGTQAGCVTCHSLEPGVSMVGPSLAGIGAKSEDFLRKSITAPDAEIAEGFTPGIMPKALADELSEQQLNDLVAFLRTLK
jgi:mono/diheme cytochrome c family protein